MTVTQNFRKNKRLYSLMKFWIYHRKTDSKSSETHDINMRNIILQNFFNPFSVPTLKKVVFQCCLLYFVKYIFWKQIIFLWKRIFCCLFVNKFISKVTFQQIGDVSIFSFWAIVGHLSWYNFSFLFPSYFMSKLVPCSLNTI